MKKAKLLGYEINEGDMPLINPAEISDELEKLFRDSDFVRGGNDWLKSFISTTSDFFTLPDFLPPNPPKGGL